MTPNKIIISDHSTTSKTIVHFTINGEIKSNNSVFGISKMAFYVVFGTGTEIVGIAPKCEYYCGPWSSSDSSQSGAGIAFLESFSTSSRRIFIRISE